MHAHLHGVYIIIYISPIKPLVKSDNKGTTVALQVDHREIDDGYLAPLQLAKRIVL